MYFLLNISTLEVHFLTFSCPRFLPSISHMIKYSAVVLPSGVFTSEIGPEEGIEEMGFFSR